MDSKPVGDPFAPLAYETIDDDPRVASPSSSSAVTQVRVSPSHETSHVYMSRSETPLGQQSTMLPDGDLIFNFSEAACVKILDDIKARLQQGQRDLENMCNELANLPSSPNRYAQYLQYLNLAKLHLQVDNFKLGLLHDLNASVDALTQNFADIEPETYDSSTSSDDSCSIGPWDSVSNVIIDEYPDTWSPVPRANDPFVSSWASGPHPEDYALSSSDPVPSADNSLVSTLDPVSNPDTRQAAHWPPVSMPDHRFTVNGPPYYDADTSSIGSSLASDPVAQDLFGAAQVTAYNPDDPFASTENGVAEMFVPRYNPEFLKLNNAGFAHFQKFAPKPNTRRVTITNLPPDATLAQVFKGICSFGGIISADLFNNGALYGTNTKSATADFVYIASAKKYVDYLRTRSLFFKTADGKARYEAQATLIPTHSYGYSFENLERLERGMTRALLVKNFPQEWFWYFLSAVGLHHVMDVQLSGNEQGNQNLVIQFTSLHQAALVQSLLSYQTFQFFDPGTMTVSPIRDQSQRNLSVLFDDGAEYTVKHIASDFLAQTYDCAPFNEKWPTTYQHVMRHQKLTPRVEAPIPDTESGFADISDNEPDEIDEPDDYMEERTNLVDQTYSIIGSTVKLTRRAYGWSILAVDDDKLLMANTLHDPEWADDWDAHFQCNNLINLRKWERYGMVVEHRRQKNAELGLESWQTPGCLDCGIGCADLKTVAMPQVVQDYLNRGKKQGPILVTGLD